MNYIKVLISVMCLTLLTACDRRDYVTWKCAPQESSEKSITMIVDGSTLKLESQNYLFCGSLGPLSYFDIACPPAPQQAKLVFDQKSGYLTLSSKPFQCKAL